jgi:tetratricopeptide (TPR) repeat protein
MTDWLSASAMLLAGVIVGVMFLYGMKRRQGRSDLERADLEAKRDALIARLREGATSEERARLEAATAAVLRKLDSTSGGKPPPAFPAPDSRGRLSSTAVGFLWGAGSVAVLAGIGWFVVQSAKPKETPAVSPMASADRSLSDLERSVQQNPDNLLLRDDLAKAYLDRENLNGVAEQTQYVLQRNPNDARALTYQALVHIAARQPEAAAAMLQRATHSDPDLIDAWVGLAWLNAQGGDMKRAEAAIDEAKRRHPEQAARLDQLMAHLRAAQEAVAPPAAPAPASPAPAAAAPSGNAVHITLKVDPNAKYPATAVIWVIARATGVNGGPPSAVKRVPLGNFPIFVDLSAADSMMGQPLPAKMRIEARIDADGDPMTHDPKDPAGAVDGVGVGASVSLTLK